jgi:nitroreductase
MTVDAASLAKVRELRKVRQRRSYTDEPVSDELLEELLEVARWSGSSKNTQPWHFIVIRDKHVLAKLGALRPNITWMENAPLAIAIVLDHADATYDEGRVTERLLIAAKMLGLGAGTAWFSEAKNIAVAKDVLGVPADKALNSVVVIGHPKQNGDDLLGRTAVGRKPLAEIVSYGRYGEQDPSR